MPVSLLPLGVIGALVLTALVALVFLYLALRERSPGLGLLAAGWAAYLGRVACWALESPAGGAALVFGHASALASAWLLLSGVLRWLDRPLPGRWLVAAGVAVAWEVVASSMAASPFLAGVLGWALVVALHARLGLLLLRERETLGLGGRVAGCVFLLLAVHEADYPLLRTVEWFAPWGFLLAFVLVVAAAFGLVIVYYDHARRALTRSEESLRALRDRLEERVAERTRELAAANARLEAEVERRAGSEAALRASEQRWRSLVLGTSEGFWSADLDGRATDANPALCALLGYSREELLALRPLELVEEALRPEAERHWQHIAETDHRSFEVRLRHKDGRPVPVFVHATTLRDGDRRATGTFAFITDLTAQKRAEAERRGIEARIEQAQRFESLGVLAGGIAHDFNNLLLGVLGNASMVAQELSPGASLARECVAEIEAAARRGAELTRQLLAYSGRGRFVVEPLDLAAVVGDMRELLGASTSRRAQLCYEREEGGLALVSADARQLRQVVLALVTNASEALHGGQGQITVRVRTRHFDAHELNPNVVGEQRRAGRYVVLEVEDDGEGIDEEASRRIFEPFYTTRFTGRGLGLSGVLGIARSHGGLVQVESRRGAGARFRVLLPALEGTTAADPGRSTESVGPTPPGAAPTGAHGGPMGLVLVADDEDVVRRLTERVLERAGFGVVLAGDGVEALARFRERPTAFAAALLDLNMPGLGGAAVAEALRAQRPDLPIVLSSGYTEQAIPTELARAQMAAFIQKPYRPQELTTLMAGVVGGAANLRPGP
jgi:PAS domain S-box-containing protein